MDEKTKQILKLLFICAAIVLFIAFAATTGLSRTTLNDSREDTQDNEKHVTFSHKDEDIVTLSVRATPGADSDNSTITLMVVLTHPENTRIESLKISIHPPHGKQGFSYGDIFLKAPEGDPYPMISYHTATEAGRLISVLDIPDMGMQGKGTVRFDFLMHPFRETENPETLIIYINAKLSGTSDFWNKFIVNYPVGIEFTR
ncbi:hypothetical protein L1S32_05050 [Methanogenium sp. S4BF]|uniref:hypothetical protein n=1 Tax=Methanogenium sp. S4BF TaxID=1789226 RepID=UPI002415B9AB|nr:hypothetical protein [Methanogenium sp. S4BF]WFN35478.1 hypothetical protein L1S32_05050 [Methanogenium sp. S4BF]